MLMLKPNCECCDKDLPPAAKYAFICTYECTFCAECTSNVLHFVCPNCSGNLVSRPVRPIEALKKHPASTQRILKPHGCDSYIKG